MPAASSGASSSGGTDATVGVPASSDAATGASPDDATVSQDAPGGDAGSTGDSGAPPAVDGGPMSCPAPAAGAKGTNPLFTDVFTADPAPFVDGCTFYIHADHDLAAAGQNAFVISDWFELASTDLVHWTRTASSLTTGQTNTKGDTAILSVSTFAWANANAWASQMVTANGKYYWYVPLQQSSDNTMAIGVAVSDSRTGPFKDAIGKPLVNDQFEQSNEGYATAGDTPFTIDPTVFVDDDGTAYLHYGSFGRMNMAKLNPDMVSINGTMKEDSPQGFFEAGFLTKHDGLYYEIYAAGSNPATIDYSTSTSPMGPWKFRNGVKAATNVLDAFPTVAGQDAPTSHAGEIEFAGQWYIVYHVSDGPNGGGTYRREVAIDKMSFHADGTIAHVTPSQGLTF
jgi:beta-xylosidase